MKTRTLTTIAACLTIFAASLTAQSSFGTIVGTVTDSSGAGIPGAAVSLSNIGTAERRVAQSDGNGSFQFVNLVPGSYRVDVEKTGFNRYRREPIVVEVQSTLRIEAQLQVGDVNQ